MGQPALGDDRIELDPVCCARPMDRAYGEKIEIATEHVVSITEALERACPGSVKVVPRLLDEPPGVVWGVRDRSSRYPDSRMVQPSSASA